MPITDDPIVTPAQSGIASDPIVVPASRRLNSQFESNRQIPWNTGVPTGNIMNHPLDSLWQLVNTPIIKAEPPAAAVKEAEESKSPTVKAAMGVRQAADDFLSSFTSLLGAGTLGLATLPKLSALLGSAFALQMGKNVAVDVPKELGTEMGKAPAQRDVGQIAQGVTSEVLGAPMVGALGAGVHEGLKAEPTQAIEKPGLQITPDQVARMRLRNMQAQEAAQAKPSETVAKAPIDVLPEYKQIPTKPKTPEKKLQERDIVSTGAYLVRNMALDPANKNIAPEQLYNTLKNQVQRGELTPTEWKLMEPVLKEELSKHPTREELASKISEVMPRVEIKMKGAVKQKPEQEEFAKLQHEWLDNIPEKRKIGWLLSVKNSLAYAYAYADADAEAYADAYANAYANAVADADAKYQEYKKRFLAANTPELRTQLKQQLNKEILAKAQETRVKFEQQLGPKAKRFFELHDKYGNLEQENKTRWQSISPKPENEMPGYVEGAVVLPTHEPPPGHNDQGTTLIHNKARGILFSSTHSFPPNTIGFFRGYMEGDTFHIIEVQSDWAQQYREAQETFGVKDPENVVSSGVQPQHPLLKDWERLTLKAAIQQALAQGAKHIAVQDAESAMMMEGHDRISQVADRLPAEQVESIKQGKGMRLHYDTIIPRILKELTGSEGEKVSFGEHKMAHGYGYGQESDIPLRTNLIFRNPDGTFKTDITAKSFDLSKVKDRYAFSLFDKDKMPVEVKQTPTSNKEQIDKLHNLPMQAARLQLNKKSTMSEVLDRVTKLEGATKQQTDFAEFLNKHFGHILSFSNIELGKAAGSDRASYEPTVHTSYLDVHGEQGNLIDTILHEAGHAALDHLLESPQTAEQKVAATRFGELRQHMIDTLPARVRKFYNEVYKGWNRKNSNASYEDEASLFHAYDLDPTVWKDPLYFLTGDSEMAAGIFTPKGNFRDMLNHTPYEGKTLWEHVTDVVKKLFGITKGSALESAMDSILELSERSKKPNELPDSLQAIKERWEIEQRGGDMKQAPRKMPSEEQKALPGEDVLWIADSVFTDPPKSKFSDWYNQKLKQIAGWSMPKTMALSRDVGNAAIRYASARIAAPLMARSLASEVLGTEPYIGSAVAKSGQTASEGKARWNDVEWQNKVGAALVEDRLRAVWYKFKEEGNDAAAAKVQHIWDSPDSPLHTQAEVSTVLNDPEVKAAIERFKRLVEAPAREMHVRLGGKIALSGLESGAFVNLKNILGDRFDAALRGGAKQGDITNPLKRGTAFGKEIKGTGKNYDFNFRNIMERMVQGNYEEYTKQHMYQEYVKAGLAEVVRPGVEAPEGKTKIAIDRRSGTPLNLWVRNDVHSELRQVLQTDSKVEQGARQWLIDRFTDAQLIGPVDVTVHLRNMFSAIAGSQGGENLAVDLARKIPGVRGLDTIVRVAKATKDVMLDTPDVQKELAEFARIGAGRGAVVHAGLAGKIGTGRLVQLIDKASRLTLSRMYDNLVERDLAKDTQEGRREFINRMGQYNTRLMGKIEQFAKQSSVSPFIVAGKNFNRLALQRLTLNPGVEAANREAAMRMRLVEAVGLVSTLMAMPMVVNYYTTGNVFGRPGVSPGAIDTGKNDEQGKPIQIDLVQNILIRRGLRNVGVMSAYKDMSQGRGEKDIIHDAFMDMVRGYASPWEGPVVREGAIALTGHDVGLYLESDDPHSLGQNLLAALRQSNPAIARYFQSREAGEGKGKATTKALGSQLLAASGVGEGRKPSLFEQERNVPGVEKMNLAQRAKLQKSIARDSSSMSPRQRLTMEQDEVARAYQVQQQVSSDLKSETRAWLKAQHLEVPGFAEYLTKTGVKVYLLPKERDEYEKIRVSCYEDAIRKAKPFVERATTPERKKKELEMFINKAHGIARNKMRNLIDKQQ
jgi:hypothetical protein